ncbi:hypothetical protein SOVF_187190 [Spinacia oleracea]|uniref:Lipid-binding protein AIR1B n=1 Tax=Spinacia oleracea TaxID=3562 RepID=A0A9R0J7X0_SPIOL|nr:putative lipid-binding protein AIR1B [Spinacia oleracea]KNA05788.1 hypothetical protein SOVF_187190 [Spinacia oleracea]
MGSKFLGLFLMVNLAMFGFVSTNAAGCPPLSGCIGIAGLLNVQFGSQSSSQCCSLLGGLVDVEAAACLCTSLKNSPVAPLLGLLGPLTGLLGPLAPLLGGLAPLTGQQVSAVFNACGMNSPTTNSCA